MTAEAVEHGIEPPRAGRPLRHGDIRLREESVPLVEVERVLDGRHRDATLDELIVRLVCIRTRASGKGERVGELGVEPLSPQLDDEVHSGQLGVVDVHIRHVRLRQGRHFARTHQVVHVLAPEVRGQKQVLCHFALQPDFVRLGPLRFQVRVADNKQ